jgi:hypothetical protein
MPDITIDWDSTNQTLTATPSPYYAGPPGSAKTVTWGPGSNVTLQSVGITAVDNGSYNGTQPSQSGNSGQWQWQDPEVGTDTYEYAVGANVSGVGVRTLDPEIINKSGN